MLKFSAPWFAAALVLALMSPAQAGGQAPVRPAAFRVGAGANTSPFQQAQSPIGLDYAPEARCSDDDLDWHSGMRPRACQPQLGQDERTCGDTLANCPGRCLKCYSDDLGIIKRDLRVNTITIYHPNYYVLKAARAAGVKVIVGVLNDSTLGLAAPATYTNCTYGAQPFPLCGSKYADALLDGMCNGEVGGDPFKPCPNRCAVRSDPARQCVNGDCSCRSDSECLGASNRCAPGTHLAPLNHPASGEFLRDGTVIGIQLSNEYFQACDVVQVPGMAQPCCSYNKSGQCNAWIVTREVISAAAQTLRAALNRRGLEQVKISVALVEKQGRKFCRNGAPPPGVDLIAAHPYCDYVAEMPALWSTLSGAQCWQQARYEKFPVDQKACGAGRTYIGETGYNTGCPLAERGKLLLKAEREFVNAMIADEPSCKGQPAATAPFPNTLFEFSDVCPPGGCLAGCGDPRECSYECCCKHHCTDTLICGANCPRCLGNGYFGLYHSPGYATAGFPLEPKFDPTPSLLCPAR